jgi:hypothetical protein
MVARRVQGDAEPILYVKQSQRTIQQQDGYPKNARFLQSPQSAKRFPLAWNGIGGRTSNRCKAFGEQTVPL